MYLFLDCSIIQEDSAKMTSRRVLKIGEALQSFFGGGHCGQKQDRCISCRLRTRLHLYYGQKM